MKIARWIIAVATIASVLPAPASAATSLRLIYRISGVLDNTGVATSVHCTNASTHSEDLEVIVRDRDGTLLSTSDLALPPGATRTMSTKNTIAFFDDVFLLGTGITSIRQGSIEILSTTRALHCTAMMLDATASTPIGISLHMVRFLPMAGGSE